MKTNPSKNTGGGRDSVASQFTQACVGCCQKALAQVARVKAALFAEARTALTAPERLLQLALNEAEAQAWQTEYPHLVFPMLATEKVQAVARWDARQRSVRAGTALAA
jgi:hypothetical protein